MKRKKAVQKKKAVVLRAEKGSSKVSGPKATKASAPSTASKAAPPRPSKAQSTEPAVTEQPVPKKKTSAVKTKPVKIKPPKTAAESPTPSVRTRNSKQATVSTKPRLATKAKAAVKSVAKKAARLNPSAKSVGASESVAEVSAAAAPAPSPAEARTISVTQKPAPVPTPSTARPAARKAPARIPPILLEGDRTPEPPPVSGPGQRYALGPTPPVEKLESEGELPKAYGTQQLILAARDPYWLYAHWDFTDEQQQRYLTLAADRHLILRIHTNGTSEKPVDEIHLHPDSRHWFAHVNRAGTRYIAQLGYYTTDRKWIAIATSGATITPPDTVAEDASAEFATIPFDVPMSQLLTLVKEAVQENVPLAEALQEIRAKEHPELPEFPKPRRPATSHPAMPAPTGAPSRGASRKHVTAPQQPPRPWTPAQERALAELISMDHVRRVWMGSMEITELIRRQVMQELAQAAAAQLAQPHGAPTSPGIVPAAPPAPGAISSPAEKPAAREKGFWFNINAELIIYGATEADASVTIAGRRIRLRPDGSFSYRFALPDGAYELPVVAVSADQTDGRAAELSFSRRTDIHGHVGVHPQDAHLRKPTADAF